MLFTGVGVALVTLFDDRGDLDADATADHAAALVSAGVRAVVVAGTTGEAAALTGDERADLLAAVRAAVDGEVPVVAGTGAPSARQAVHLTRRAIDGGADGVLVLSQPRVSDPVPYYRAVADAAGTTPVLAYHFPTMSPPGLTVEQVATLPVAGCKDSTGDAERLLATVTATDVPIYTGSSALLSYAGPLGCAGAILALANLRPAECAAAFTGDPDAQRALAADHLAARTRFPQGLKALLAERVGLNPSARLG